MYCKLLVSHNPNWVACFYINVYYYVDLLYGLQGEHLIKIIPIYLLTYLPLLRLLK